MIERVLWLSGAGVAVFVLGIAVYACVSFALMRSYVKARPFPFSLRSLWREIFVSLVTQPFLPLYYLVGRRMTPRSLRKPAGGFVSPVPVVFVHGYMQNRVGFLGLARALARRRIGPLYGINYPWFATIASNAERLERFIDDVCRETGSSAVDLVCHSMGGLVAMETVRTEASDESKALKVRRCVTIATPHGGVMWRGPLLGAGATNLRRGSKLLEAQAGYALKLPMLSIFSDHDNIVFPQETASLAKRGGRDVVVEGLSHLAILFAPDVADHVSSFLLESDDCAPAPVVVPEPVEAAAAAADTAQSREERHRPTAEVARAK